MTFLKRRLAQLGVTPGPGLAQVVSGVLEECDRPCMALMSMGGPLCGGPARWVCCDENRFQWFACEVHAAEHTHVRIRVGLFLHFARKELEMPRESWHASPKAPAWLHSLLLAPSN